MSCSSVSRLSLAAGLLLGISALPASATVPFGYDWSTKRVSVSWREGNDTPDMPALRRQVGHWKRLAQTLWTEKPGAPPLSMDVSLYGSALGGEAPPRVRLKAGERSAVVEEPITEAAVARALLKVRDGAEPSGEQSLPADDTEPSVSPDGKLLAMVSWRGSAGPEVWITRRHAGSHLLRVRFPGPDRLLDRLILTRPQWSAEGRLLAWVQGGRLVLLDSANGQARIASPPGKRVLDLTWPPAPFSPLAVRYEDGTFDLLDLLRGRTIPLADVLREARPQGELFWSPSGKKLLFRVTGAVRSGDLSRVLPQPGEQPAQDGEQVALLDLASRRLETFPAAELPSGEEIRSLAWSPREDLVYIAAGYGAYPATLLRFPLRSGEAPRTVMAAPGGLAALGARGEGEFAFLKGDTLVLLHEGTASGAEAKEDALLLRLRPGPHGGYRGVEMDAITEDEAGLRVVLERGEGAPKEPVRRRFPGGLHAWLPLESPLARSVWREVEGGVVDLDLYPEPKVGWAAVVGSPDGGVCRVAAWDADTKVVEGIQKIPFTERISGMKAVESVPREEPYPATEAGSGLSALANQYRRPEGLRIVLGMAAVLTVLVLGLLLAVRGRSRPE